MVKHIYRLLLLFLISCNQGNRSTDRSESILKDTSNLFLTDSVKNFIKQETLTYLKCLEGVSIDSLSKYLYEGSLKSLMAQDSLLNTQEKAFEYLKGGILDFAKEIKKEGYKFKYNICEIDKITLVRNMIFAQYKVITTTKYKKIVVYDTTTFVALSIGDKKNWKFLNKKDAYEPLSFEFDSLEIKKILK